MNTIIAIAVLVSIWALVVSIVWGVIARTSEEPCICTYYDDKDLLDSEDCD